MEINMDFEVKEMLSQSVYNDIFGVTKRVNLLPFLNKTVVITGAAEGLGFYLACALLITNEQQNTNTKIVAVDTDDRIFARYGKLTYRKDIEFFVSTDYSYLGTDNADFLIHTNSFSKLDGFDAAANLFRFISENNVNSVIVTDFSVYGEVYNGSVKISENDLYGYADCSKAPSLDIQRQRMIQSLAVRLSENRNIKLAALSEVYGADSQHYADIFKHINSKQGVTVNQSEKPQSVIYIADAAVALFTLLFKGEKSEIYNIASDDVLSPVILAEKCSEYLYGGELKVTYKGKQAALSYMDSNLKIFDNTKLKALGFAPEFNLQSGITRTLAILSEKGGEA